MGKHMRTLVISGINLFEGGALSIYHDCLYEILRKKINERFNIIAFVHKKELFKQYGRLIKIIELPKSRESYINRLWYEYFYFYRLSVKNRPVKGREVFTFLNPDNSLTAKNYFRMLIEHILIGRTKQHIEEKKMLIERQKERAALSEEDKRKEFEELQNIKRDSKGRLNKGAKLAKKASCNETKIYLMYELGATVKEIIEMYGCSKSVVYRVLAKHK